MPYTGSGANKVPLGKINPILLGQKKDAGGSEPPSLLSQHLSRKKDADFSSPSFKGPQGGNQRDGPWNSQQGDYGQQGSYNQQGNYPQSKFNPPSQGYGSQSNNYGDSRQQSSGFDSRQMNAPGNAPPRPLMSLGGQHGPQPPFNHGQSYGSGGMNYQNSPQGYGMPPMPSAVPPNQNYGSQNYQGQQGGYGAPLPPMPSGNSFNQPPPPPSNFGGPPLPPGGLKANVAAPPPPLPPSKFSSVPPPAPVSDYLGNQPSPPPKKRKRRSRWGDEEERTNIPGMPASLPSNVTPEQKEQYLLHFKIEEISIKLRSGDLGIPANPEDRSPSPEPIYNTEGKRLNTREFRVRKNLEEERHSLIQDAVNQNADYKPPIDYKPPSNRIQEKVMIPQDANPAINFIGLLIGPRGNTLKKMEKETNCKIIIRGKGSVKEGKVGRPGFPLPGENEPLHALVTGPSIEDVKHAVKVIENIIKEGVETPEGSNELRKMQLRELAALNGTLIEEDLARCRNCGATDHRHWECTEVKNITSQVICTKCGGYGHVAKDCVYSVDGDTATPQPSIVEKAKMDDEYMSLMAELGVDAPPGSTVKSVPAPAKPSTPQVPLGPSEGDSTTALTKSSSSAAPPWSAEPKPMLSSSASTSYPQRVAPQPLMQSYSSNVPPTSSSQWRPRGPAPSHDQRSNDSYQNNPRASGTQGMTPLWSQQGSQQAASSVSGMGPPGNLRGPPMNGSPAPPTGPSRSGAPPPWQAAPLPWQQPPAAPYAPPAGFGMPPGVMYPQMGQSGPPIPPWSAPPPPPPPPSK